MSNEEKKPAAPSKVTLASMDAKLKASEVVGVPAAPSVDQLDRKLEQKVAETRAPKEHTIPVKLVDWDRTIQLPGKQSEQTAKTERKPNGESWAIEYLPALRAFRVTFVDPNRANRSGVRYVPVERAVSWEPMP